MLLVAGQQLGHGHGGSVVRHRVADFASSVFDVRPTPCLLVDALLAMMPIDRQSESSPLRAMFARALGNSAARRSQAFS